MGGQAGVQYAIFFISAAGSGFGDLFVWQNVVVDDPPDFKRQIEECSPLSSGAQHTAVVVIDTLARVIDLGSLCRVGHR